MISTPTSIIVRPDRHCEAQNPLLLAIGDYTFDYGFHTKASNQAFQLFTKDGVWKWL